MADALVVDPLRVRPTIILVAWEQESFSGVRLVGAAVVVGNGDDVVTIEVGVTVWSSGVMVDVGLGEAVGIIDGDITGKV